MDGQSFLRFLFCSMYKTHQAVPEENNSTQGTTRRQGHSVWPFDGATVWLPYPVCCSWFCLLHTTGNLWMWDTHQYRGAILPAVHYFHITWHHKLLVALLILKLETIWFLQMRSFSGCYWAFHQQLLLLHLCYCTGELSDSHTRKFLYHFFILAD